MSAHETRADTPDARASLAGEGATTLRAGNLDVPPSVKLGPAGGDAGRAVFSQRVSRKQFCEVAARIIDGGGVWQEVADALGMSADACRIRGHRYCIKSKRARMGRRKVWTDARIAELARLVGELGVKGAARRMGADYATARMALSRAGYKRSNEWVRS